MQLNRVGEKYTTTEGYLIEIVEYEDSKNCSIEFESGYRINNIYFCQVKRGNIRNPFHPTVYGVGYLGVGRHTPSKNRVHSVCYKRWRNMLER